MKLSNFGQKFATQAGIVTLMDDLGTALTENPNMIFMGGGNPGRIDAVEEIFKQRLEALMTDPKQRHSLLGVYQAPQGDMNFREELARYLKKEYGWAVTRDNIAVANGSQSAFFMLYNLFAGDMPDGGQRKIHLPLVPEYLGYADVGLTSDFFSATQPSIEMRDEHLFKYRVDFSELNLGPDVAALSVSRPTNPTGNVLTDNEIRHLDEIAHDHDIPLIIDGAYGLPFPNILFADATPYWNENVILGLSLSKLGLPGVRTGILVAREDVCRAFSNANTVLNLASGTLGPALVGELFRQGEVSTITDQHIRPFYSERATQTVAWFQQSLAGLPFRLHVPEGAFFLWLWMQDLPISSRALYERLKARGVLVVPGEDFFIGIDDQWGHQRECLRVSYAQKPEAVRRGVEIIGEELHRIYAA